jgi:hypothetical protein
MERILNKLMKKLTLSRETVRNLDGKELESAAGGRPIVTSGDPTLGIPCISVGCE